MSDTSEQILAIKKHRQAIELSVETLKTFSKTANNPFLAHAIDILDREIKDCLNSDTWPKAKPATDRIRLLLSDTYFFPESMKETTSAISSNLACFFI